MEFFCALVIVLLVNLYQQFYIIVAKATIAIV